MRWLSDRGLAAHGRSALSVTLPDGATVLGLVPAERAAVGAEGWSGPLLPAAQVGATAGFPGATEFAHPTNESDGRMKSPPPDSSSGEPKGDYERTLAALRASPNCRRIVTSGSTVVWMLSSPEQLAAVKRALKREKANPGSSPTRSFPRFRVELSAQTG